MDPLETLLRPVTNILNRNIQETTPARELCQRLDGTTVAVRVRDTALAMYFEIDDEVIVLATESASEPDVIITGSLLTLARLAGASEQSAVRNFSLDLSGDAETAQAFQELLAYVKPDIEEELSTLIGDVASHRAAEISRGVVNWARDARRTFGSNIREYLQEESGDLPSRYEVQRFTRQVDSLRDDVARLEARLNRLVGGA
ncbi:MAG: SCP2 sterol-binding domain-containing protein, partial [Gammaproteobacteria bacterium]|nr:SCP2 sterol-binding domain-containing protein [Gammaproteobacteria bacterium]MDH3750594.1 SCP2 sterol-binding domain-containing protein [Gammaproteobacteria bacterium]MDH3806875.1 SCP2 sterol-binding domain-containing protein [Gammaproteobacteria bacterium]